MTSEEGDLTWIPRIVRNKLDMAEVRIHLADWQRLSLSERRMLVGLAGENEDDVTKFRSRLLELIPEARRTS